MECSLRRLPFYRAKAAIKAKARKRLQQEAPFCLVALGIGQLEKLAVIVCARAAQLALECPIDVESRGGASCT